MPFNFRELKKDEEVTCVYVGYLKSVGAFRRPVFAFMEGKKEFHLWGTVMLNYAMYGIPFHTQIVIKFIGMVESDKSKHKMKGFEISVLDRGKVANSKKRRSARPRRS
jgi:hypothetical protein